MASHVHLTGGERLQIYPWQGEGLPRSEIARRRGGDRSTVSRELRRNAGGAGSAPHMAEQRSRARHHRCRRRLRMENRRLRRLVMDLLQRGLSPEQIAGRLRVERGETVVSAETIGEGLDSSEAGEVLAVGESSKRIPRCARDDMRASRAGETCTSRPG